MAAISFAQQDAGAPAARLRRIHGLSMFGILAALWMLAHHAPRHLVEAELTVPVLLLLFVGQALAALQARPLAPLIAIVGCDGSGKSTLSADLQRTLGDRRPVATGYLGLGTGDLGNRIKRWPMIGPALEKRLVRKAGQTRDASKTIPGLPTAMVVFALSLLRVRRFRRVLAFRRRGVTVITDRYPQIEVAGFYDGPGLSAARPESAAVSWLAVREHALYAWMASFRPDLVIRLNVDADTALRRKPDHKRDLVSRKIAATSALRFNGARVEDVDATLPFDQVRAIVLAKVGDVLGGTMPMRSQSSLAGGVALGA